MEGGSAGVYSKTGWRGTDWNGKTIYLGSYTAYKDRPTHHTGYLQFVTAGGKVLLDGDNGKKTITFDAGSEPTVTPTEAKITVLAQKEAQTSIQNFAFPGMEDYDETFERTEE